MDLRAVLALLVVVISRQWCGGICKSDHGGAGYGVRPTRRAAFSRRNLHEGYAGPSRGRTQSRARTGQQPRVAHAVIFGLPPALSADLRADLEAAERTRN
jgi:hypothetical protein